MSKYTTQVRYICEYVAKEQNPIGEYDTVDTIIKKSWNKIFDDVNIVLYKPEHKEELCCKILKHYYTREIGEETYGLWKLRINTKLAEILPYYNEMYKSAEMIKDPLVDKDITRTYSAGLDGESDNRQGSSGNTIDKFSDTPQGGLTGLREDRYLTNARMGEQNAQGTSNTKIKQNEQREEKLKGKDGIKSYSQMLMEYRQTIVNIDVMIINELSECFMNIY